MTEIDLTGASHPIFHENELELLRTLWHESLTAIAIINEEGRFLAVNPAWTQLVEYTEAELLKLTWQEITAPKDLQADSEMSKAAKAGEIQGYDMWKTYIKKSGYPVRTHLRVTAVHSKAGSGGDGGKFLYYISQAVPTVDITRNSSGDGMGTDTVRVDSTVVLTEFLKQNKGLIGGLIAALTALVTAVATAIPKLF